jgi:flagellar basal body-associated protein FliL
MVKKAKLDILEINVSEPDETVQRDDDTAVNSKDDISVEKISGGGYLSKAINLLRRPRFWIILIVVGLLGLITLIGIFYYRGMVKDVVAPPQNKRDLSGTHLPEAKKGPLVEGMVVDQNDISGKIRIVFCDIALDLEHYETANAISGDRVDVRGVIYNIMQKEMAEEGLSPEGRSRLKEKIKNELNGLFRENLVKRVYFMRYELK